METDERRSPTPLRPTLTRFPPSCHGRNERSERGRGVRWVHDIFWSIPCILLLHVMNPPHPHPASRRDGHEGRERKEGAGYGVSFSESFRVHVVHVNPAPSTVRPSVPSVDTSHDRHVTRTRRGGWLGHEGKDVMPDGRAHVISHRSLFPHRSHWVQCATLKRNSPFSVS